MVNAKRKKRSWFTDTYGELTSEMMKNLYAVGNVKVEIWIENHTPQEGEQYGSHSISDWVCVRHPNGTLTFNEIHIAGFAEFADSVASSAERFWKYKPAVNEPYCLVMNEGSRFYFLNHQTPEDEGPWDVFSNCWKNISSKT